MPSTRNSLKRSGITGFSTVTRTYRLSEGTARRIEHLAGSREIWPSSLVEALLQYALAEVDAGRIGLLQKPVKFKLIGIERKDPDDGNDE